MSKLVRAGLEAVVTIIATLGIIVWGFSALLGIDGVLALSGVYYASWAGIILVTHLAFAHRRRHIRLSFGVGTGVVVMAVHLVMFLTGNISVDMNMVPVIMHDFGFALISMIVLNIVHLVIFRRRRQEQAENAQAAARPNASERVDDIPAPDAVTQSAAHPAGDRQPAPDGLEPQAKTA